MKKVLSIAMMMLLAITANAQEYDEDSLFNEVIRTGIYEVKRIVTVEGATSHTLYVRAMEALSDWTGVDGNSKIGLDFCDKDAGIVTYKGDVYNGKRKIIVDMEYYYTDFTMKVRCKDGRAQITITVPSMYKIFKNKKDSHSIKEVVEKQMKSKKKTQKKKKSGLLTIREVVSILMNNMERALTTADDDDF